MLKVEELQKKNAKLKEDNSNYQVTVEKLNEEKSILEDELNLKSDFQETKVSRQVCLIKVILLKNGR